MVKRKRASLETSAQHSSGKVRKRGREFSRKLSRKEEFFPDSLQRQILCALVSPEGDLSVSDIYEQCLSAGYKKTIIQQKIGELERLGFLMIKSDAEVLEGPLFHVASGSVELHRDGFGFFVHDGGADWYIRPSDARGILNGDRMVALRILNSSIDRAPFAVPLVLTQQGSRRVILIVEELKNTLITRVLADEIKDQVRFAGEVLSTVSPGDVILAELGRFDIQSEAWSASMIQSLGKINDPGIEVSIALHKFGIPGVQDESLDFEVTCVPEIVDEASLSSRVDLRGFPFVTIDGPDAKDFDDAVYVERCETGYSLYVAIADVSHYVKQRSLIDQDASKRSTSVYFPRLVCPMLPEELSSGICSLKPNQDRLVVVVKIELDSEARVIESQFILGVIRSKKRLTYSEVDVLLDEARSGAEDKLPSGTFDSLINLKVLTQALLLNRHGRGALEINARESRFVFNELGQVSLIKAQERFFSSRMIEEAMLCANVAAAEFLKTNNEPFLYRAHPEPDLAKIAKLEEFLVGLNFELKISSRPTPSDFLSILEASRDHPAAESIQTAVLRTMNQARYTPTPTGHFGLAYQSYTHFTSPIRRYPDLMVHRAIKIQLGHPYNKVTDLEELGEHCSSNERKVEEAVRWTHGWLNAAVAGRYIGEEYAGRVVSVASFGCFIFLDDLCLEGLLHVSELGNEFFYLDDGSVSFTGSETGATYRLGDSVPVYISEANVETGRVTLKRAHRGKSRRHVR
ncbi:MAG: ribonuclease R [Proteobacteria bacterium]|nr:ribonuclease R [Pseudomonadota bacterium]